MSGFADLVLACQPAYFESAQESATVGRTWAFDFEGLTDFDGTSIDLTSGFTATCEVYDGQSGSAVTTLTVTLRDGGWSLTKPDDATASVPPGRYGWRLQITETSSSSSAQIWGGPNAVFTVLAA